MIGFYLEVLSQWVVVGWMMDWNKEKTKLRILIFFFFFFFFKLNIFYLNLLLCRDGPILSKASRLWLDGLNWLDCEMVLLGLAVGLANRAWKSKGNWLKPRALPPLQYGSARQRGIFLERCFKSFQSQNLYTIWFNIQNCGVFFVKSTIYNLFSIRSWISKQTFIESVQASKICFWKYV